MHGQEENYVVEDELSETEPESSAEGTRASRRAGILAGLTVGAFVIAAVACDPTPTVVSFA